MSNPDAAQTSRPRNELYVELLVTVGLLAVPAFLNSLFVFQRALPAFHPIDVEQRFALMAAEEFLLIGLLFHILKLNRENFFSLSHPIRKKDIWVATGLVVAAFLTSQIAGRILVQLAPEFFRAFDQPANLNILRTPLSLAAVLVALINPFCEELLMRGFLQTRLKQAGWNGGTVVLFSVLLQSAYHLYQGLLSCVLLGIYFLIWAVYYHRTRRLWPVLLAHLYMDLLFMFQLAG